MSRASRVYIPGHVFHITQRCHKKEFLLKFKQDRSRYRYWLFKASQRYDISVLNYIITSNHIHLLIKENNGPSVQKAMQYASGCFGREYNRRKKRKGAYWEDNYHMSIIETEEYLMNCFVYIDLNMVRAKVVGHPIEWPHSGYYDLYQNRERYRLIKKDSLLETFGFSSLEDFKVIHSTMIDDALIKDNIRNPIWTEEKIIGCDAFVQSFS